MELASTVPPITPSAAASFTIIPATSVSIIILLPCLGLGYLKDVR